MARNGLALALALVLLSVSWGPTPTTSHYLVLDSLLARLALAPGLAPLALRSGSGLPATRLRLALRSGRGLLKPVATIDEVGRVSPVVETEAVPTAGDGADDVAIWVHPQDTSLSRIIGTDKRGGIAVYDLSGRQIQYIPAAEPNNVDVRYNFPLGGERVSLVAVSRRSGSLGLFAVDATTGSLVEVAARSIEPTIDSYGFCLYHSPVSDKYYGFVTDEAGAMEQWELFDDGTGKIDGAKIRSIDIGSQTEGCVADDFHGALYAAEEDVGIWRYGAEPQDGDGRRLVDSTGPGGHLTADVEGVTVYQTGNGAGYLIASNQGTSSFVLYERGGSNPYLTTFEIVAGEGIDAVSETDGIDVVNLPLGTAFPEGLFVAQDDENPEGNQNFKLVSWGSIARAVTPALKIDTSWDLRLFLPAETRPRAGGAPTM